MRRCARCATFYETICPKCFPLAKAKIGATATTLEQAVKRWDVPIAERTSGSPAAKATSVSSVVFDRKAYQRGYMKEYMKRWRKKRRDGI